MLPDDATPPGNATPSDASTVNGAHQQPQEDAGVELQCLAQPQSPGCPTRKSTDNTASNPLIPSAAGPDRCASTASSGQPPQSTSGTSTSQSLPQRLRPQAEASAGVRRELPMSGFPTAAELDDSVTCFHRYLDLYFMMAAALGTPILPTLVPKASSWLNLS
ncbi:hypothetical protein CDEST_15297 [Colletotrichum destructivum]|uniref:Uncharacterized protein n=1 Tax=Colletotrichum destructivum TaxID=34406 RepID=A0AAX4J3X4_9PEZI|nr:hypothetical protein CDEST_15297 [Colletotrichum destructivum]